MLSAALLANTACTQARQVSGQETVWRTRTGADLPFRPGQSPVLHAVEPPTHDGQGQAPEGATARLNHSEGQAIVYASLLCGPYFLACGIVTMLAVQSSREREWRRAEERLSAIISGDAVAACLRLSLLDRSQGRLRGGADAARGAAPGLRIVVDQLRFSLRDAQDNTWPPGMVSIRAVVQARLVTPREDRLVGEWVMLTEARPFTDWADEDGAPARHAIDGMTMRLADRMLADLLQHQVTDLPRRCEEASPA